MPILSLVALLLAPAAAFVATPAARSLQSPRATAQMLLPEAQSVLDAPTLLLAKSEADLLLDEVFTRIPLAVGGGVLGVFVGAAAKDTVGDASKFAAPAFAVLFLLGNEAGLLGSASGLLAKVSLDAWNVFAGLVLKGAILKY